MHVAVLLVLGREFSAARRIHVLSVVGVLLGFLLALAAGQRAARLLSALAARFLVLCVLMQFPLLVNVAGRVRYCGSDSCDVGDLLVA